MQMKNQRTKFAIVATHKATGKEYLICRVVAKGDAFNILNLMQSQAPEYLTYQIKP
jgi:hypothetical protein